MLTDMTILLSNNHFRATLVFWNVDSFVCHITAIDHIKFGYFLKNNLLFLGLSFCFYVDQGFMVCCILLGLEAGNKGQILNCS